MPKKKRRTGNKDKDGQLVIRINKSERDEFVRLCEDLDTSAAREIRHFIRDFIEEHGAESHEEHSVESR